MRKQASHTPDGQAEADLQKIRSAFLRRETSTAYSEPHTVIVELNLPAPEVKVSAPRDLSGSMRRRVLALGSPNGDSKQHVSRAQKLIEKIIGHKTDAFFPSSSSFVVSATGNQIRELAGLDLVSAIWPNELQDRNA